MPGCVSLVALGVALVVVDDLQEDMAEKLRLVAVERLVDVVLALVLVWTSPEKVEGFSDSFDESEEREWARRRRRTGA